MTKLSLSRNLILKVMAIPVLLYVSSACAYQGTWTCTGVPIPDGNIGYTEATCEVYGEQYQNPCDGNHRVEETYARCNVTDLRTGNPYNAYVDSLPTVTCTGEIADPSTPYVFMGWVTTRGSNTNLAMDCQAGRQPEPAPPPPAACSATSTTIDYQNIPPSAFSDKMTKSALINVSCTGDDATTVVISLSQNSLNFTNGGKSSLTVGGAGGTTTTINVASGATVPVNVTSVLSGTNVSTGTFTGSTSIILSPQ